jgi:ribA/ribD-fused uncharacterized protein
MIDSFSEEYEWLSNFEPCNVEYDGVTYPFVENAYCAAKTDVLAERKIFEVVHAGKAKRLGKKLVLRDGWEEMKIIVMTYLLLQKFKYGSELGEKLIDTEDQHIEEGNHWKDVFWGVCEGIGENHMGIILMQIRNILKQYKKHEQTHSIVSIDKGILKISTILSNEVFEKGGRLHGIGKQLYLTKTEFCVNRASTKAILGLTEEQYQFWKAKFTRKLH